MAVFWILTKTSLGPGVGMGASSSHRPTSALFLAKTLFFLKKKAFYTESTYAYIMPPERSIDVDSLMDLKLAEWILTERCLT